MLYKYQDKKIGVYDEHTQEFHKWVKPIHFMRKFQGYGIDEHIIEELPRDTKVIIHAPGKDYITTIGTYQQKGIVDNYGHGKQVFLATAEFNK